MARTRNEPIDYDGREPVTRRSHVRPWAANLETRAHARDRNFVVREARDAVTLTGPGAHVDLVTHQRHGHPIAYLYDHLESLTGVLWVADRGRCDCGGYVTRVAIDRHVRAPRRRSIEA